MSTVILDRTPHLELDAKLPSSWAVINDAKSLNVIDLNTVSSADAYHALSNAAGTTGVALINNLPVLRLFKTSLQDCTRTHLWSLASMPLIPNVESSKPSA